MTILCSDVVGYRRIIVGLSSESGRIVFILAETNLVDLGDPNQVETSVVWVLSTWWLVLS